ncbi:glycosyltransferase family 4 protein [Desmospora profundinema]|uniref:Glycosyltransferase involved in cell wall biosynthesis n=1 Tax=Desmospora profundinema TaxID=1571184 RepID=A0ABU1ILA0_9BACL|nr:glycosyltransferase family 4 protein [Desmospora profundinema]MDR6225551.1 glycosyltransferase involved in cell wall biosynthesis [Desmospora profundinema]
MKGKAVILSSVHRWNDSRIFHKQAVSLARAGWSVELHALADFEERMEQGVHIIGLSFPKNKWVRLKSGRELFRRALASGGDLFHIHDPELLPWAVGIRRRTGKPVIYDAHEDLPQQITTKLWIPPWVRPWLSRVADRVEKGMARRLSAVVTVTEPIAKKFSRVDRVSVIKNYPLPIRTGEREQGGPLRILYVGGISYLRGYREMIVMMDHLPKELGAELHLIGPLQHIRPEDRDEAALKEKKVFLHGRIPFGDVQSWLLSGSVGLVCLHPVENYRESLPIKLFEYMAAGLPVVATDFPLWRGILEDSGAGVTVDPLDPVAMARQVAALLQDPDRRRYMGEQGRKAFSDVYNWCAEEKKLVRLYQELTETGE